MDEWAEAQQLELDPEARREIQRQMWDYDLEKLFRISLPNGYAYQAYQSWVRGIRTGGRGGSVSYDEGAMLDDAWVAR